MFRRAFLGLASSVAFANATPSAAQGERVRQVALLSPFLDSNTFLADFRDGMRGFGYSEGRNLHIEYRSAEGQIERLRDLARELVDGGTEVLVTSSSPAVQAARQVTDRIPIVMARVGDAVDLGIVSGLAHPGANVTGASWLAPDLSAKALELLHEAVPDASHVAVLREATAGANSMIAVSTAARRLGLRLDVLQVRDIEETRDAFAAIRTTRAQALEVLEGVMLINNAELISRLAADSRIPSVFFDPAFVEGGGLMSYGPNFPEMHRRAAYFVDRILKGARPKDLPVEQPTRLDLVVNLKAARRLGISLPTSMLIRTDRTIE